MNVIPGKSRRAVALLAGSDSQRQQILLSPVQEATEYLESFRKKGKLHFSPEVIILQNHPLEEITQSKVNDTQLLR